MLLVGFWRCRPSKDSLRKRSDMSSETGERGVNEATTGVEGHFLNLNAAPTSSYGINYDYHAAAAAVAAASTHQINPFAR